MCQAVPTCSNTVTFRNNCTQCLQQQPHDPSQVTLRRYCGIFALFLPAHQHNIPATVTHECFSNINPSPPSPATPESPAMPRATWFRAAPPATHSHRMQNCLENPDGGCPSCFPVAGLSPTSARVPLHRTQLLWCGKSSGSSDMLFIAPTFPPVTLLSALRTQFSYISAH